jgi:hypothetical protein
LERALPVTPAALSNRQRLGAENGEPTFRVNNRT